MVPGQLGAAGKHRCVTSDWSSSDLEQLAAEVGRGGADAHPCEHLAQPGLEGAQQVDDGSLGGHVLGAAAACQLGRELDGEPGHDGAGARRERHRRGVDVQHVGRIDHDVRLAAQARVRERRMDGSRRQHRADRKPAIEIAPVAQDDQLDAIRGRGARLGRETTDRSLETAGAERRVPGRVERPHPSSPAVADAGATAHEHLLERRQVGHEG